MPTIQINNLNLGGIAKSAYQGLQNSVQELVGLDIHSEPGIIKVNQKLTKDSGTTIDDLVKKILPCSDGYTYLFGSTSGKIWRRDSLGNYTLVRTASPAAGRAGIKDAIEDQGFIYYTMQNRVGRFTIGGAWDDDWATFLSGDSDFHPIIKVNLIVYIGDGKYVAQIEDGTFTGDALDLKDGLRIKALGTQGINLLSGTYIADNVSLAEIFDWNTWSVSFSSSDPVQEKGINCFLKTDNYTFVSVGEKGKIYFYDGQKLTNPKRIPGSWGIGNKATIFQNAAAEYNIPIFGVSNVAGNPCLQGVYGYGGYDGDYTPVLTLEYIISQAKTSGIQIGAIEPVDEYFLVSWQDGSTKGIDKLDASNKQASAYFTTRAIAPDRANQGRVAKVTVPYRTIPDSCEIQIWKKANYEDEFTQMTAIKDNVRKTLYSETSIDEFSTVQIKVVLVSSGNNAPEIEGAEIEI